MSVDAGTTVLVVEDEESFVDALTIGLKREGFRVEVARRIRATLRRAPPPEQARGRPWSRWATSGWTPNATRCSSGTRP
jgi:hypothetical protein